MITALLTVVVFVVLVFSSFALFTAWTAQRVDAALPPPGKFIDIDGSRIHYVDKGSGEPILMIHGLGAQLRHLTYSMVDLLAKDYRVIAFDRPGAGNSSRAKGASASFAAQADLVARFIQKLELERPLLVGHSMGGAIALAIALDHPDLVRGLVLIAPFTQVEHEPPEVLKPLLIRSPVVRQAIAWTVATPLAIINKDATLASLFGPEQPVKDFATSGGALLSLRPQSFISASEDIVAIEEEFEYISGMVSRYPSMTTPTWILYGKGDRVLDYRRHGELTASQIPEARLDLVEGGHMLPLTMPERAAEIIRQTMSATAAEY